MKDAIRLDAKARMPTAARHAGPERDRGIHLIPTGGSATPTTAQASTSGWVESVCSTSTASRVQNRYPHSGSRNGPHPPSAGRNRASSNTIFGTVAL